MAYPIIHNGDHAEFEAEWAASGKPDTERPDWPLPSFDASDWAAAFCKIALQLGIRGPDRAPVDEGWMITWFANALMRGFDEHAARASGFVEALQEIAEPVQALQRRADAEGSQLDGAVAVNLANDAHYLRSIARVALSKGHHHTPTGENL